MSNNLRDNPRWQVANATNNATGHAFTGGEHFRHRDRNPWPIIGVLVLAVLIAVRFL